MEEVVPVSGEQSSEVSFQKEVMLSGLVEERKDVEDFSQVLEVLKGLVVSGLESNSAALKEREKDAEAMVVVMLVVMP